MLLGLIFIETKKILISRTGGQNAVRYYRSGDSRTRGTNSIVVAHPVQTRRWKNLKKKKNNNADGRIRWLRSTTLPVCLHRKKRIKIRTNKYSFVCVNVNRIIRGSRDGDARRCTNTMRAQASCHRLRSVLFWKINEFDQFNQIISTGIPGFFSYSTLLS